MITLIIVKPYDGGYLVINTEKKRLQGWKKSHTHLKSKRMARQIKKNVERGRIPKTRNEYLLESHIRISMDEHYQAKVQHLIDIRQGRKPHYINVNKGVCR